MKISVFHWIFLKKGHFWLFLIIFGHFWIISTQKVTIKYIKNRFFDKINCSSNIYMRLSLRMQNLDLVASKFMKISKKGAWHTRKVPPVTFSKLVLSIYRTVIIVESKTHSHPRGVPSITSITSITSISEICHINTL